VKLWGLLRKSGALVTPGGGGSRISERMPGKNVSAIRRVIGCVSYTGTATTSGSVE
jgi:hypothetical protein